MFLVASVRNQMHESVSIYHTWILGHDTLFGGPKNRRNSNTPSAWQMPSEAFHSAPNATALPALAPIRGRMKNDRALCPPQNIYALLEGMILGNGTKLAVEPRHSIYSFFFAQGAMAPMGPGPPKRGPRAHGPILVSSGEICALHAPTCASLDCPQEHA